MNALSLSFPAMAVSAIYCLWHAYMEFRLRRERRLCERVAYLLWTVANLPERNEQRAAAGPFRCTTSEPTPLPPTPGPIPLILAERARRRGP
jgi:hypothetical protein